jgi:hypothetical protein
LQRELDVILNRMAGKKTPDCSGAGGDTRRNVESGQAPKPKAAMPTRSQASRMGAGDVATAGAGRLAAVTGGGSGVGASFARLLAALISNTQAARLAVREA